MYLEELVHQVNKVKEGLEDQPDQLDHQEVLDHQDVVDLEGHQDLQGNLEFQVYLVHQAELEVLELEVLQDLLV